MKKILIGVAIILALALFVGRPILVKKIDGSLNVVLEHEPYSISPEVTQLHASLIVGDWHADTTLWERSMKGGHGIGHVDLERMQKGNLGLQMFTTVTKSPSGLNYESNETEAGDDITTVALTQLWPIATWSSLTERALYQAKRVHRLAKDKPEDFKVILSKADLADWYLARQYNPDYVGGLIGTEGSHALDGELSNIDVLYQAGFRMMSLQHFFDNKLGGSLHGTSGAGLTDFGKEAVKIMQSKDIIVDVSHSSEAVVRDVLAFATKPLVVSHTGFKGHCDTPRNISDELMQSIAQAGGLIAVGFWDAAACGTSPQTIVESIQYGIDLGGVDHVALGSDYDGTVTTSFDASELAVLTHWMLAAGMPEDHIRKVMGDNMARFLRDHLPD